MPRYFIEVGYNGKCYAGFQKQENANTIQAEIEKALTIFFRTGFNLTGSSRTDAGVHAVQNFFHFDSDCIPDLTDQLKYVYPLNAILPRDIVVKSIRAVNAEAHCRFEARSRTYEYSLYRDKDPFLGSTAFFYPFALNKNLLDEVACEIKLQHNFATFSKRRTQVHSYICRIDASKWFYRDAVLVYSITANRFLRGMVKGLVGTMLKVGREKISPAAFSSILQSADPSQADFSVPSHGLTLVSVEY